jgi:hypothetical protein
MARRQHTIWDGVTFRQVSPEEAADLVAADKAQDLTSNKESAFSLKRRKQFTGYTAKPAAPTRRVSSQQDEDRAMTGKVIEEPMKHWLTYRPIVARKLDKPTNKVTKAEVDAWWTARDPSEPLDTAASE